MITKNTHVIEAMAEAIRLLKLIDRRKIKYKNSWQHLLGELDGYLNDQMTKSISKNNNVTGSKDTNN